MIKGVAMRRPACGLVVGGLHGKGSLVLRVALLLALLVGTVLPSAARAAGNVYVTNNGSSDVSQYAIGTGGALSALTPPSVAEAARPWGLAVNPDGRSAYVANISGTTVSQYNIDPRTGALSPKTPAIVTTGSGPVAVAVTPDGKSVFVTNYRERTVNQYDVDSLTGALAPKTPPAVAAGGRPNGIAVSPDGRSAYVANSLDGTISQYSIDPLTGALSPKTPATVAAFYGPLNIAVTPDGKSAYVANNVDLVDPGQVSQFDIDALTGALSPKTPATVDAGYAPLDVAVTPDGKSAYVTSADGAISQYTIDSDSGETLSPKSPPSVGTVPGAVSIAVSADGKSAYVTILDGNTVSQYNIDPLSGTLSPKTPAAVAAGLDPVDVAVAPLPLPDDDEAPGNRSRVCNSERASLGESAFRLRYGTNRNGTNAFGKCVSAER